MCIAPNQLPNGENVACRKCWQCKENRVNDWVGRCIAESRTALATYAVTLTYGRNEIGDKMHERAAVLTYSDLQKYFKNMRAAGHKFKYLAVGEYGSKKGRAHWHVMMFFYREAPDVELSKRIDDGFWPHGYAFWEKVTADEVSAVRYICKYVQKDLGDDAQQGHLAMSKKPPLGSNYFAGVAQRYVDQGLAPNDLFYEFAGVNNAKGERIQFMLQRQGKSADLFIREFVSRWEKQRPGKHWPHSDIVEWFQDKWVTEEQIEIKTEALPLPPPRVKAVVGATAPVFDHLSRMYKCTLDGAEYFWMADKFGGMSWQKREAPKPLPEKERIRREFHSRVLDALRRSGHL